MDAATAHLDWLQRLSALVVEGREAGFEAPPAVVQPVANLLEPAFAATPRYPNMFTNHLVPVATPVRAVDPQPPMDFQPPLQPFHLQQPLGPVGPNALPDGGMGLVGGAVGAAGVPSGYAPWPVMPAMHSPMQPGYAPVAPWIPPTPAQAAWSALQQIRDVPTLQALGAAAHQVGQEGMGRPYPKTGRAVMPDKWMDTDTKEGRDADLFLNDCRQYANETGALPVPTLEKSLKGKIRKQFSLMFVEGGTWEQAVHAFKLAVGSDLRNPAHEAVKSVLQLNPASCMRANESVVDYALRFREKSVYMPSMPSQFLVSLFTDGLTEPFRAHLAHQNQGEPLPSLEAVIQTCVNYARSSDYAKLKPKPRAAPVQLAQGLKDNEEHEFRMETRHIQREHQVAAMQQGSKRPNAPAGDGVTFQGKWYANVRDVQDAMRDTWAASNQCFRCGGPHARRVCDGKGPLGPYLSGGPPPNKLGRVDAGPGTSAGSGGRGGFNPRGGARGTYQARGHGAYGSR